MKLISCHIDNFGTLHDFDMTFEDGLNVVMHDNGWGKSTFAAFLKAMLYGYDNKRSKDLSENDRKHYKPWQGGKYGGTLTFEKNGTRYMVWRFFGETARYDTMGLRDLDAGKTISDVENVGEWLFKLDADAFKRSAYINSNQLNNGSSALSFHARLNAVLGEASDVGAFDSALTQLVKRIKDYEKTGNRGYIADVQKKIDELLRQQRTAKERILQVENMRKQIAELDAQLAETDTEIAALKATIDAEDSGKKERDAARKLHQQLVTQREQLEADLDKLLHSAGGVIPTLQEINAVKQNQAEIARINESLTAIRTQKEKEIAEIQAQYDALLDQDADLDQQIEQLMAQGQIPEEAEVLSVKQGRPEMARLTEAIETLKKEEAEKVGHIQSQYDELVAQQTALEVELEAALSQVGGNLPSNNEIQAKRHNLSIIEQIKTKLDDSASKITSLETTVRDIQMRYGGRLPTASELSSIAQLNSLVDEAKKDLDGCEQLQCQLSHAEKSKAELFTFFKGELPEQDKLAQCHRELTRIEALESAATGLEAQAAGEHAKIESLESAIRQLETTGVAQERPGQKPTAVAEFGVFAGAGLLTALGVVFSPFILVGAVILAILGAVLHIGTNKKKAEFVQKQKAYEDEQRHTQEKKLTMEKGLLTSRETYESKTREATQKREDANALSQSVAGYIKKWNPTANKDNFSQICIQLQEKLEMLQNAERIIIETTAQIEKKQRTFENLKKQFDEKRKLLPADTLALPINQRVAAAEEDAERIRQMEADIRALHNACLQQEKELHRITADTETFFRKYGIALAEAVEGLLRLEQSAAAIVEIQQRLAVHRRSVSDFEKLNQLVLDPTQHDITNSAVGKLQTQLQSLQKDLLEIYNKYSIAEEKADSWIEQSRSRITIKNELNQKKRAISKQIHDFETANENALRGDKSVADENSAQSKLEKQLAELCAIVMDILNKYQVSESDVDAWLKSGLQNAEEFENLDQRLNALEKQIDQFEAEHKNQLAVREEYSVLTDGQSTPAQLQLQQKVRLRDSLLKNRTQAEDAISHADEFLESYRTIVSHLRILSEEKQKANNSLFVLKKSIAYLKAAKENLATRYMGQIEANFNQYFSAWVKSEDTKGVVDADFNITMDENGTSHDVRGYSTGYCDVIDFCMRLALIDTLFEEERPFIIMDDPFVNLDANRLEHAMQLLKAISAHSQIIYFVCHEVRASEPTAETLEIAHKKLIKTAKPKTKPKTITRKDRFTVKEGWTPMPMGENQKITNSIFSLVFTVEEGLGANQEFEVFFADENEKVLCDRQQIFVVGGELVHEKVRFCLNTGNAAGKYYYLYIRKADAPENEVAKKIAYEAAVTFTADFDF